MDWHKMTPDAVMKELAVTTAGLDEDEAGRRLERYGKNELREKKKQSALKKLLLSFADTMTVVLFIAAAVSFTVSRLQGESAVDSFIILGVVCVNGIVSVIQESKAEKSLEALKRLTAPEAKVLRGGTGKRISGALLVPGDIVSVRKGDFVPADCRIINEVALVCDESSLTGEPHGVYKTSDTLAAGEGHIASMRNMIWSGTTVMGGHAEAVVVATGMKSYVGGIADMLTGDADSKTPLQKRLAKTGTVLGNAALVICLVIFAVSLIKGFPPAEMFLTSVSLAVAAIPEGLPAIVTIMLSLGVTRMAKKRAIVRRLPAVETLGCTTVICSDKTGTLTRGKMTVCEFDGNENMLAKIFASNNDDSSPTEKALLEFAKSRGYSGGSERIAEIPFDSKTKFMATLHRDGDGYFASVKGAPEIVFGMIDGLPRGAFEKARSMAERGLRVMCGAYARLSVKPQRLDVVRYTYAGIVGMSDPPRDGVAAAVAACREAGIRPVMITGDHKDTAVAIAKEIGIMRMGASAFTQSELEAMRPGEMRRAICTCAVFARTTPEFKLKIVETLRESGETVAMTGDGVNDAPALKKADIGCAMGVSGTDVAKEASDIILTDDNFSTIVSAVEYGRTIYANIRRAVHFLISCNIGEIITMFAAIVLSLPTPLTAVQLLWVNLVTDSLPAAALGFEKPSAGIMRVKPVKKESNLFGLSDGLLIAFEGLMIGALSLAAYFIGDRLAGAAAADTMCFCVLSMSQLFHAYCMRSEAPLFRVGFFGNPMLIVALAVSTAVQLAVMLIPSLSAAFDVVPLSGELWTITVLLASVPLILGEVRKIIFRR